MTNSDPDVADIHTLRRRADVMCWTNTTPETSIEQTHAWLRDVLSNHVKIYNFVVELRDPAAYLLWPPNDDFTMALPRRVVGIIGAVGRTEVGYMVHPAYKGRGIATEALEGFMPLYWAWRNSHRERQGKKRDEGEGAQPSKPIATEDASAEGQHSKQEIKSRSDYDYVDADTDAENYASQRVLLKCGFVEWERTEDDFQSPMMGVRSTVKFRLARPGTHLRSKEEYAQRETEHLTANGIV